MSLERFVLSAGKGNTKHKKKDLQQKAVSPKSPKKYLPPFSMRFTIDERRALELAKLLGTLGKSRISQNINQLAKAANSGSLPVNQEVIEELNDACKAINCLRNTLMLLAISNHALCKPIKI